LGDDWEEIGVISPSRHDMLVQVTSDSSACYFTLVHANVEAMSPTNGLQDLHCLLGQRTVFEDLIR
jgi:hypothetical protein